MHRKTISEILYKTKKLQKISNEVELKSVQKKTLEYEIDTLQERVVLLRLIKNLNVTPVMRKIQQRYEDERSGRESDIIITEDEISKVQSAAIIIENLLKGIDQMHKIDIHFHTTKILTIIQNMDKETANILIPELKRILCDECPFYRKYKYDNITSSNNG